MDSNKVSIAVGLTGSILISIDPSVQEDGCDSIFSTVVAETRPGSSASPIAFQLLSYQVALHNAA